MKRLFGVVQNYAWGSTHRLAELRGDAPSADPEAEIWYGAHTQAPSSFEDGSTLLDAIAANPDDQLGADIVDRYGEQLPFLVKFLAADSPLSIQAHPSAEQARAGCAAEDAAGIDRTALHRCFRDDNPKPELVFALSHFEALVGFRFAEDTARFIRDIGAEDFLVVLSNGPKSAVEALLAPESAGGSVENVAELVSTLVSCCAEYDGDEWSTEAALIVRLNNVYPNDPGVGVAALLNYIVLEPGRAIFLGAGHMHAYVSGLAVEVMANSDNVLRGGLTPKHIDVPTLLDIVVPDEIEPVLVDQNPDGALLTNCPAFAVTVHDDPSAVEVVGPQIVVAAHGKVTARGGSGEGDSIELGPTEAVWISAGERVVLDGTGLCFSTTTGVR